MDDIHFQRRAIEGIAEAEIKNLLKFDLSKPNLEMFQKAMVSPIHSRESSPKTKSNFLIQKLSNTASNKSVRFMASQLTQRDTAALTKLNFFKPIKTPDTNATSTLSNLIYSPNKNQPYKPKGKIQ